MQTLIIIIALGALVVLSYKKFAGGRNPDETSTGKAAKNRAARAQKAAQKSVVKDPASQYPYRATIIRCKDDACDAAKAVADKPFLDRDNATPRLPVPGCTKIENCRCSYEHRNDRRDEGERRVQSSLLETAYTAGGGENRRKVKRGRRSTD